MVARRARTAAALAATGLVGVACFQVFLALGGSWGSAAWGGGQGELSGGLRVASAFAAVLLAAAALVVLGRAGYWPPGGPSRVFRWGTWILVAMLSVSALANFASTSDWERLLMGPIALVLALLCLVVARSPRNY